MPRAIKTSYLSTGRAPVSSRVFKFAVFLFLGLMFIQPLAVLADQSTSTPDQTIISDGSQNPAQQQADVSSNLPPSQLTSDNSYSASTTTPPSNSSADQSASSTPLLPGDIQYNLDNQLNNTPSSTPAGDASSTPDSSSTDGTSNTLTPCVQDPSATSTTTPDSTATNGTSTDNSVLPASNNSQTATTSTSSDASLTDAGNANSPCAPASDPVLDSANASSTQATSTLEIVNLNDVTVKTVSSSTADSGANIVAAKGDVKNNAVTSGDVNVYANILTVANINLVNSQIVEMNDNFNKLSQDLYLNQPELTTGERTQDLVSPLCSGDGMTCQSISTFKLTNQNVADVQNNVNLTGNSGGNQVDGSGDVKNNTITTGNVNAVVNVLNIVNANAVNSRWTIVTFNVFGDWTGDLVMPSELYFSDGLSAGGQSSSDLAQVQKIILDVNNSNSADISNNVTVNTDTGTNTLQSLATDPFGGDVKDNSVTTGNNTAQANAENVSNLTVYNSKWFLGLINVLGSWSGQVYSLPQSMAVHYQPSGFSFVSTPNATADQQAQIMSQLEAAGQSNPAAGDSSACSTGCGQVGANSTTTQEVGIDNSNQATINNDITVNATTGENSMTGGGDVKSNTIQTGNATALANILNFANANLINSDLQIGLVNVFGNWQGNVVFGYPDLSVGQSVPNNQVSGTANSTSNVQLNYTNQGNASMADSQLEWKFDPSLFALGGVQAALSDGSQATSSYTQIAPGDIRLDLGKLAPGQGGSAAFQLTTLQNQSAALPTTFFANLFGNGPETNLTNNQNTLTVLTTPAAPGSGSSSGNSGSGQTGGQSSGSGSSGSSSSGSSGGGGAASSGSSGGGGGSSSGGGGGAGSSGGGGVTQSSSNSNGAIGVVPNLLHIYKVNNAGAIVKPGDKVHFTITVDNDGNNNLNSLVVYDTLRDSAANIINNQSYNIDSMASRQEVKFDYDLQIASTAVSGVYTNSAYVQGLNDSLQTVRSQSTALSSFTVGGTNNGQPGTQPQDPNNPNATSTPDSQNPLSANHGATSTPASLLGTFIDSSGQVLGTSCVQPSFKTDLKSGSVNNDVKALAVYLNTHGFVLTTHGAGSPGKEITSFGPLLKAALTKFQKYYGLKELGVFGSITRGKLNSLLNVSGLPFCQPAPAVSAAKFKTPLVAVKPVTLKPVKSISVKPTPAKKAPVSTGSSKPLSLNTEALPALPSSSVPPVPAKPGKTGFWSSLAKHLW